jgi:polysaccharide export outer membrane protein
MFLNRYEMNPMTPPRLRRLATLPALLLALSGCTFIPAAGPRYADVLQRSDLRHMEAPDGQRVPFALVALDAGVLSRLEAEEAPDIFGPATTAAPPFMPRIGPGDMLGITIFEAAAGGLFIPTQAGSRPGNFVNLPLQQVSRAGTISVPYAGQVRAAGLTVAELQQNIEQRLSSRALEPQVLVTFGDRRSNLVSVIGDVTTSTQFALDPAGERLLNALSRAGGPRYPAYETIITLQRGATVDRARLSDIARWPEQNVQLQGQDVVFVSREPRYFLALGATGPQASLSQTNRRMPFEGEGLNLADAIARAGGLQDDRADPRAVFVFRHERKRVLQGLGLPVDGEAMQNFPTVYQVDMSEPSGMFLANGFPIRSKDIVFVSTAGSVDLLKFLQIVQPVANAGIAIELLSR